MTAVRRGTFGLFLGLGIATTIGVGTAAGRLLSLDCPIRSLVGFQCPGCGSTRCVAAISAGDFSGAARSNPLLFGGLATMFLYGFFGVISPTTAARISAWVGKRQRDLAICIISVVMTFTLVRNLFGG